MKYLIACLLLLVSIVPAHALERNATLDVFASKSSVEVGGSVDIAIRQTIRDHWHTYWKNAGDSGEPITLEWSAPEGATRTAPNWIIRAEEAIDANV